MGGCYGEQEIAGELSELLMREPPAEPLPKRYVHRTLKDCLKIINLCRLNQLIRQKTDEVRLLPPDSPRRGELARELLELSRRRACAYTSRNPLGPEPPPQSKPDDEPPTPPPVDF